MDNYCIALLVLVLFFLYIDNQNKTEGYDDFGSPLNEVYNSGNLSGKGGGDHVNALVKKQDYKPIGQVPQKVPMDPPSSMVESLNSLSYTSKYARLYVITSRLRCTGSFWQIYLWLIRGRRTDNLGRDHLLKDLNRVIKCSQGMKIWISNSTLADSTLDQVSDKLEVHMVYADWCGHSKSQTGFC